MSLPGIVRWLGCRWEGTVWGVGQDGIKACGDEFSEAGAGRVDGFDRAVLSMDICVGGKSRTGRQGGAAVELRPCSACSSGDPCSTPTTGTVCKEFARSPRDRVGSSQTS